jgi:hypothetical protein
MEMMLAVTALMYTVSLEFQLPTSIIIHNQCSDIELILLVYFGNGAVCPRLSGQQININTSMKIRFEINITQDEFEGALLYKLQRKLHNQYSMNTLTTRADNNEAKYVYMLAAWKMKDFEPLVYVVLVEHTREFIWNEDKLKTLYYANHDRLKEYNNIVLDTWFVDDNVVLKMTFNAIDLKRAFELSISISEEERNDYAMRPLYVDPER